MPSAAGRGTAYVKFSHPASRYAVIGVAVSLGIGTKGGGPTHSIDGLTRDEERELRRYLSYLRWKREH